MPEPSKNRPRWFPTQAQLKDPSALERTLRQILTQHYSLLDEVRAGKPLAGTTQPSPVAPSKTPAPPPPGSGPTDSMLVGLQIKPVDTSTLADGATLKFVKASGDLEFS